MHRKHRGFGILLLLVLMMTLPSGLTAQTQTLILGVPYLSDHDVGHWQGALVLMIFRYWGKDAAAEPIMRALGGSPTATITPDALVRYFQGQGFRTEGGASGNLDVLRSFITRRIPIIVMQMIAPVGAEREYWPFRIVLGVDETSGRITVHDYDRSVGWAWPIARTDFMAMWQTPRQPFWYLAAYPSDYESILAAKPAAAPYPARTPDQEASVLIHFAFYAFNTRVNDALQYLERAITIGGVSPDVRATIYNNLAAALNRVNRFQDAAAAAQRAIELKPDLANPHKHLGDAYMGLCKQTKDLSWRTKAIEAYQKALALNSQYAAARQALEEAQRNTECR
jgi:hypothetical protein